MSQYKTGSLVVVTGSTVITGSEAVDWSSIKPGYWLTTPGLNATYNVVSINRVLSAAAWSSGPTYAVGDIKERTSVGVSRLYVATQAVPANKPPESEPTYWIVTSGWQLNLTSPYVGVSGSVPYYALIRDFTPNLTLPLIAPGDIETGALYSRAMLRLDQTTPGASRKTLAVREDFLTAGGFIYGGGPTAPTNVFEASEADHPGIFSLNTSGNDDDTAGLCIGDGTLAYLGLPTRIWEMEAVFKLTVSVSEAVAIGLSSSHLAYDGGGNKLGLSFDTDAGHTTFRMCARASGVETLLDSGVTVTTGWHVLRLWCEGASKVFFTVDASAVFTITTNLPTAALTPTAHLQTRADAITRMDVDFMSMFMSSLNR